METLALLVYSVLCIREQMTMTTTTTTTAADMATRLLLLACALLAAHIPFVMANCEKAIFRPPLARPPPAQPSPPSASLELALSQLDVLAPTARPSMRACIDSAFPTADLPHGKISWFLLDQLAEGTRYEVRLCWSAAVGCPLSGQTHPVWT